jgi:HD-GYP domain-containing protein (c-di-GMP phosphodiesterase class II)
MATKVPVTELKVGMFVADLDRPWVDTPFLLQGFLIEDEEQIRDLMRHCQHVMVDRTRSTGDEYEAPPAAPAARREAPDVVNRVMQQPAAAARGASAARAKDVPPPPGTRARGARAARGNETIGRLNVRSAEPLGAVAPPDANAGGEAYPGLLGRVLSGIKGLWQREEAPAKVRMEVPKETAQEFEARAALAPPGVVVTTYIDAVTVEEEVPHAELVVQRTAELLEKLTQDIRLGGSFEVEAVQEVVDEMVESIVRNPDALMWVARLREQDIGTYGHGLQVSVYLTAFGRHLGFPKPLLASLAQIGLLLDLGKMRLPHELLQKQGRLTTEEFEQVKAHVQHSLDILGESTSFDPEMIQGIAQHHERMNGSGYPQGLMGEEIAVTGRMAGIVDCFAALINHRPYAAAVSSYEALRSISGWGGDYFHEALVQQFVSSVGVFPVGSMIELSSGEVAIVVAHNKLRRLKPRVLVVTGPDKKPLPHPAMVDLLYDPRVGDAENVFIKRGLAHGAYGLDLGDFYLSSTP